MRDVRGRKNRSVLCEAVKMRRRDIGRAVKSDVRITKIVTQNEDDVRPLRGSLVRAACQSHRKNSEQEHAAP